MPNRIFRPARLTPKVTLRMHMRTIALPALAASVVLSLSACDPTAPGAGSARPTDEAARSAPAVPLSGSPADSAIAASDVTLVDPATGDSATAQPTPAGTPGPTRSAGPSAPTRAATASPSGHPVATGGPALKLASYNQQSGKVVLAAVTSTGATPSPSASAAATAAVRPGQLIDSPPTTAAPRGALLAVTAVKPAADGKVEATTRPATISELLGEASTKIRAALDPHQIQITPQVKNLKTSYVPRPDGASGSASAVLELDANDSIPLPGGGSATLSGSIALDPSVEFSYHGAHGILSTDQAKVGFDLGAHADWHVTAGLRGATTGPVRFPIANLTATPTVTVGAVPVVITLNLTVYAEISADGSVTVDAAQSVDGDWGIHADYAKGAGWTSATEPVSTKVSPVKAEFAGTADVRTGLVAEGSVALYDAVGVKATIEPYLRAAVHGTVGIDSGAGKPVVTGKAGLYAGLDVNGAVMARIAILGTPLLEKDLPFNVYQNEWPIVAASSGN
jgi:predicted small secreted protein